MTFPDGPSRPAALQTLAWVRRPFQLLDDCRRRFGPRFTLRFVGGRRYVLLTRPEDVRALFQLPSENFGTANAAMTPFLGAHSMFVLEGERHRRHRRLIGPPLRRESLAGYAPIIDELTAAAVARWPVGEAFPVIERMRELTLDIIFRVIFGVHEPARAARLAELVHEILGGPTAMLAFIPLLHVDLGKRSPWGAFLRRRDELRGLLLDEVRGARAAGASRDDVLARMTREGVAEGDPLADDEIVDELVTLMAAGHETATAGLAWAFQWILGDATLRVRIADEARDVLAGGALDHDKLERMTLLEAAVHEALRLSPIIPIVPRLCSSDTTIGDLTVPAGTYLTACAYLTQRESDLFPEPERFSPERFLGKRPSVFEWYPFGGGFRHCIGAFLALYEMRAILAGVLGRATLSRPDTRPQKIGRQGITVTPREGTPVVVERRA